MDRRTALVVAIIGALALIIAAIIGIWPYITKSQRTPVAVSAAGLEAELSKANIILTEVPDKHDQVREWLLSDLQYQVMAQTCLTVLNGKRVIDPVQLDVIVAKYRVLLGGNSGTNYSADRYTDRNKAKEAIFKTWKEQHPDSLQKSFDEIVVVK